MAQPEKVGGAMAYLAHMVEPALIDDGARLPTVGMLCTSSSL